MTHYRKMFFLQRIRDQIIKDETYLENEKKIIILLVIPCFIKFAFRIFSKSKKKKII